jgi:hypothetical protein
MTLCRHTKPSVEDAGWDWISVSQKFGPIIVTQALISRTVHEKTRKKFKTTAANCNSVVVF